MKEKRERRKRSFLTYVILFLVILLGLSLLLYPTIADYINSLDYYLLIDDYKKKVDELDDDTYLEIIGAAQKYNEDLLKRSSYISSLSDELRQRYESLLSVAGTGLMGYIEIPKVNIYLPIYHGVTDAVLQAGIGHVEGSSLPIGGKGVHTVLSGHTGLPSAKLFTDIDKLVVGDTFIIHVLREELTYEVYDIEIILPEMLSALRIEEGQDLCTLMTCTPYGLNTHRLLIRGKRIQSEANEEDETDKNDVDTDIVTTETDNIVDNGSVDVQPVHPNDKEIRRLELLMIPVGAVLTAVAFLLIARKRFGWW